jgi:hypothetical protein
LGSNSKAQGHIPRYASYWIEDGEAKQQDANGGKYFEIRFCDAFGQRDEQSIMFEAESYTGSLEAGAVDHLSITPRHWM